MGTAAIITLADLDEPQVLFWVEEADLASVAPGNRVGIIFEALPDYTFPGEILSIDPVLVEVDGTPAVQILRQYRLERPSHQLALGHER